MVRLCGSSSSSLRRSEPARLNPIKPAYDRRRLTAGAFSRLDHVCQQSLYNSACVCTEIDVSFAVVTETIASTHRAYQRRDGHLTETQTNSKQELSSCWDGRPYVHNRHGPKVGRDCCGGLGSHLTQCGLGRGLPLYQVASWSIQPFGHNCRNATLVRVGIRLRTIFSLA